MALEAFMEGLIAGTDLDESEATALMQAMVSGEVPDAQIAGVLVALRVKGASAVELSAFARVLSESAITVPHQSANLVDTCGTGGGKPSFNLSTGAAIVAAAAGASVAKHGNRGVTSKCGSADVLESLGVRLAIDVERASSMLDKVGIVFLFAQSHHPVMKAVGPVRKALGIRTVFNQLGPLANPARAKRQLVGVSDHRLVRPTAEALRILGSEHALVVHSSDGLDEISPCADTFAVELKEGHLIERVLSPESFGLDPLPSCTLTPGETIEQSAHYLQLALSGEDRQRSQALIPNASAALYLSDSTLSLTECAQRARVAIETGAAMSKLAQLVEASQRP